MSDQERAETAAPKRRALFFGVQAYLDEALPARPGTSAALRHLAELFELDGWSVRLLIDDAAEEGARPLRANLLAQLRWLAEGEARFAFLSCACAGVYLLPRDARVGLFEQTALDISQVGALLKGAGVLLDMPARPEALDGAAWALGLPIEERAELSAYKQGPTPFLKRALRGLSGQAGAIGAPITNADLARFMITDSSRAHAAAEPDRVAPWFFGSASPILTPRGRGATCGRCGERIEDALATFCPACGQSLFGVERLDGGRYRLLRALGEGGMGKVFLAEDTRLKAERAIKLLSLPSGLPQRERAELRGRLLQEAQAAQQLSGLSQHIVQVYDLGYSSEHGEPFLVMEVLKGETLTSRLAQGPLGLDATVRLGREIASTLAIAHGEGMIHRDLKPDNIMLIQRGGRADFVKLLDFGLVKMEEAEVKTATGHIMGTLQYMPPEQLKGEVVDHRADIFAFSAILYECISGARAIAGRSQREIFAVLLGEGVEPLAARCPQMPKALTHLIDRGLSLDMEARPESVSEFLAVFDALTSPRSSALMTQALDQLSKPKRDLGRLRLALGFLIGLALGGLGGPLLSAPSPSPVAPQALDVGLSAPPPDARPPAPDVAA
ncbi:serine/threonine protein kinase, partial [Myxococcota bacterium]|nr:serine/threonine protein kinase [Myxococcota bacterium]